MPVDRSGHSLAKKALSDPLGYPDEFKAWLARFLADNPNLVLSEQQMPAGWTPLVRVQRQFFTASGTWNPTPGTIVALLELVGAGGGGGGGAQTGAFPPSWGSAAGGGGGGEYVNAYLNHVLQGAHAVTVGVAGVSNSVAGPGTAGGNTSVVKLADEVGTIPTARGGAGGGAGNGMPAVGPQFGGAGGAGGGSGATSFGDNFFTIAGEDGSAGWFFNGAQGKGGDGGMAAGTPGGMGSIHQSGAGFSGNVGRYGSGGEGAFVSQGIGAHQPGLDGKDGIVVITEYVGTIQRSV